MNIFTCICAVLLGHTNFQTREDAEKILRLSMPYSLEVVLWAVESTDLERTIRAMRLLPILPIPKEEDDPGLVIGSCIGLPFNDSMPRLNLCEYSYIAQHRFDYLGIPTGVL